MPFDERNRILFGNDGSDRLATASVCVFGLGGVGATAAMDLARAGVGNMVVIDFDTITESNLNRLYFGYTDTAGKPKVDVFVDYARRINPSINIKTLGSIVRGAGAAGMIPHGCDFYLDCIDTLNPKTNLMAALARAGLPFASSMGTAGRMAPERLKIGSLWETHDCPLSTLVRKRLRRMGFGPDKDTAVQAEFLCVWSDEPAVAPVMPADGSIPGTTVDGERVRAVQGSGPFVPQAAGHILASLAVRRLLGFFL